MFIVLDRYLNLLKDKKKIHTLGGGFFLKNFDAVNICVFEWQAEVVPNCGASGIGDLQDGYWYLPNFII